MMKRFFTMMLLAASAGTMMAQGSQQIIPGDYYLNATLQEFSYNGQAQIFVRERSDDRSTLSFLFYDDDFSRQGTLTVPIESISEPCKTEEREWLTIFEGSGGYIGDWRVTEEYNYTHVSDVIDLDLRDFDQSCDDFRTIYLTQTLFNTDEKYEYLLPVFTTYSRNYEEDRDGDGMIDRRITERRYKVTGFKIMSETGSILQTVAFENGFNSDNDYGDLIKVNGKLYLGFEGYVDEGSERKNAYLVYSIDRNTSSVRMKSMDTFSNPVRYTLDGRRTKGAKGINIIRKEDGTVKKVFVK